jgi:transposase
MSCAAVAKVLFIDDDTVRTWHRLYEEDGIEGLAGFGHEGSSCRLNLAATRVRRAVAAQLDIAGNAPATRG